MKRDMDLVRLILIRIEDAAHGEFDTGSLSPEGYDRRTVAQHVELLEEARLLEANLLRLESEGAIGGRVERLTWDGHEYLAAVRNATIWSRTKKLVGEKLGSAPLEVFKSVATKLALDQIGGGGS
jgi:hypothetical protein